MPDLAILFLEGRHHCARASALYFPIRLPSLLPSLRRNPTSWIHLSTMRIMITGHSERGREYGNSHGITTSSSGGFFSTKLNRHFRSYHRKLDIHVDSPPLSFLHPRPRFHLFLRSSFLHTLVSLVSCSSPDAELTWYDVYFAAPGAEVPLCLCLCLAHVLHVSETNHAWTFSPILGCVRQTK